MHACALEKRFSSSFTGTAEVSGSPGKARKSAQTLPSCFRCFRLPSLSSLFHLLEGNWGGKERSKTNAERLTGYIGCVVAAQTFYGCVAEAENKGEMASFSSLDCSFAASVCVLLRSTLSNGEYLPQNVMRSPASRHH
ncbi:hypothetical protein TGRUB_305315 [Toxoplasma gondii RUB]|uniref:Uncharacterized protein n=1 Tax=Toxoplasma gondii RUB TaxID=935652 RepID=A0A086LRI6_TOXGO|nr:hypothetical protein TGRUB_305315 [Toxoplasma gondii RUB]